MIFIKSPISPILTNHQKILKSPQNGNLKGTFTLVPSNRLLQNIMKKPRQFRQWWKQHIYPFFLLKSTTWQFFTIQWPNPTGIYWNCQIKAMCKPSLSQQTENSGENGAVLGMSLWKVTLLGSKFGTSNGLKNTLNPTQFMLWFRRL